MRALLLSIFIFIAVDIASAEDDGSRCTPPNGGCNRTNKGSQRPFWFLKNESVCYSIMANDCKGRGFDKIAGCIYWCLGGE
uniref:Putative secreted peptide n=1 Tax=Rhipicephalus pulchellus TaxID=72859 RepID=L7M9D0_RHIPC